MQPNPYHTLSPAEREELALCGISSEDQLLKATATQLCRDLRQARNFFPDRTFTLTPEKIHSLFPETGLPEKSADAPLPGWRSAAPVAEFRSRSRSSRNSETHRTNKQPFMLHSPVRCTHRATAILAAFCTLFLLIPDLAPGCHRFCCALHRLHVHSQTRHLPGLPYAYLPLRSLHPQ